MTISAGTRLRDFEVVSSLGSGGMGEVFRARDTRLGRDVALKLLPASFTADRSRRKRFELEAKTLAALSHPGIAAIHDFFEHDGHLVIVMELVDGETLNQRLLRGAFRVRQAIDLALQMAHAIEHAHARGILHRDLKPGNVQITGDGRVKLLDFGLARMLAPDSADDEVSTTTIGDESLTGSQTVLGTAPYMSPEQARGEVVDRRSDVFSFASVTYEVLTAKRAFPGRTRADTIVAVLEHEPAWEWLPRDTPVKVRDLLRRCLHKDRDRRLHDIADARIELEEALSESSHTGPTPLRRWIGPSSLAAAALLLAVTLALFSGLIRVPRSEAPAAIARITLSLSTEGSLTVDGGVAISPDGQTVAFAASSTEGSRVYVRRLDEWEPRAIPGTEGATNPFFSPDGEWIAFTKNFEGLEKIPLRGGPPQVICKVPQVLGGSWGGDGSIVFGGGLRYPGLWRVSADGGTPGLLSSPEAGTSSGVQYVFPHHISDTNTVLFTVLQGGRASIAILPSGRGEPRTLVESGVHAQYLPTGHILYVRDGHLIAAPFDAQRLEIGSGATVVIDDVNQRGVTADYEVSRSGVLAFVPGWPFLKRLVWKDRRGGSIPLGLQARRYGSPSLASNGELLAVTVEEGPARNVWIGSPEREPLSRLTFANDDVAGPWTPDGQRLLFTSGQRGAYNLFWTPTDGSGKAEQLTAVAHAQKGTSWSPAGDVVLLNDIDPTTGLDILELSIDRNDAKPFVRTPFRELEGVFSPDGHWVAYQSDESGRFEVYVRAYPSSNAKKQVSIDGGFAPLWSRSGRELFYQTTTAMMGVPIVDRDKLQMGAHTRLFQHAVSGVLGRQYDVSPDGQRFLMVENAYAGRSVSQLNLVMNWFEDLVRIVPGARK